MRGTVGPTEYNFLKLPFVSLTLCIAYILHVYLLVFSQHIFFCC